MTPQELKASILQLAIQGKLVEQRPEEGTGAELLAKILATKNTKGTKKNSHAESRSRGERAAFAASSSPSCPVCPGSPVPPADAPFDIPESWEWVCVGELFQHNTGKALNSADKSGTLLEYITTSNVYWNRFDLDKLKTMYFTDAEVEKCTVQKGDLLVLEGGDIGRAAIWNYDFPMRIQNHIHRLRPYGEICVEYFYHVFYYLKSVGSINGKGIGIKGLSANVLHSLLIPLPPLAEQKRIVAKIEELLPYIDRYEKAWSKLEDFNKRFPGDMQKSLLQMAIQGKLVDQRPEEGTGEELYRQIQSEKQRLIKSGKIKKEKPLPEITPDEIPFDIPESWKWVRIADLWAVLNGDRGKNYPAKSTLTHIGIPFISAINLNGKTVVRDDNLLCLTDKQYNLLGNGKLCKGDIVVCIRGSLGKHGRYPFEKGAIASSLVIMRSQFRMPILDDFLMLYLDAPLFFLEIKKYDNGTAQPNLAAKSLEQFLFPLPPLAEQKRIVAKLEEFLPLCERLK